MKPPKSTPTKAGRSCAYCNEKSDLTLEHILPHFIETREAERGHGKSITNIKTQGQEKPVQSEPTIGDVCRTCNNGFLAELDGYGAELYDKFFKSIPRPGEKIRFAYDFDQLLRWLLKLAYNTGRSRGWSSDLLQPLRNALPYIKDEAGRPNIMEVFLQLVVPARLSPKEKMRVEQKTGQKMDELPPEFRRITVFVQKGLIAGYRIALNGYYFHILFLAPDATPAENRSREKRFYAETKGAKKINPNLSNTDIYPSSVSILDLAKKESLLRSNIAAATRFVESREKQQKRRRE
jgi:hypothetical protein